MYRIALCQDLLGHRDEAIAGYQRYLEAEPASDRQEALARRIEELSRTAPTPAETPAPQPDASVPAAALAVVAAPAARSRVPVVKKWWFWTALVVGAGAVATAIAVPLATRYLSEDPFIGTLGGRRAN